MFYLENDLSFLIRIVDTKQMKDRNCWILKFKKTTVLWQNEGEIWVIAKPLIEVYGLLFSEVQFSEKSKTSTATTFDRMIVEIRIKVNTL